MFNKRRFLDIVKDFIVFGDTGEGVAKILAGYHQFHAVRHAVKRTLDATRPEGDRNRTSEKQPVPSRAISIERVAGLAAFVWLPRSTLTHVFHNLEHVHIGLTDAPKFPSVREIHDGLSFASS